MKEFEKDALNKPIVIRIDPKTATWRNVNARNLGPLNKPEHDDIAEFTLKSVVISVFVNPKYNKRSRNIRPNCCRTGNPKKLENPAAAQTTQPHPPSGATKLGPRSFLFLRFFLTGSPSRWFICLISGVIFVSLKEDCNIRFQVLLLRCPGIRKKIF